VELSPVPSTADDNDLDPVVDMVISSVGLLEPDLFTPIAALDMCSFQSVYLLSNEYLLEAMTAFSPLTWCHSKHCLLGSHDQEEDEHGFLISGSLKTETSYEHGFLISSSLKNETSFEHGFLISSSLKNETIIEHNFLISSSLKNETSCEDSFCISVATSLKNETEVTSIVHVSVSRSLKNETEV
jgi:hypothetical protein